MLYSKAMGPDAQLRTLPAGQVGHGSCLPLAIWIIAAPSICCSLVHPQSTRVAADARGRVAWPLLLQSAFSQQAAVPQAPPALAGEAAALAMQLEQARQEAAEAQAAAQAAKSRSMLLDKAWAAALDVSWLVLHLCRLITARLQLPPVLPPSPQSSPDRPLHPSNLTVPALAFAGLQGSARRAARAQGRAGSVAARSAGAGCQAGGRAPAGLERTIPGRPAGGGSHGGGFRFRRGSSATFVGAFNSLIRSAELAACCPPRCRRQVAAAKALATKLAEDAVSAHEEGRGSLLQQAWPGMPMWKGTCELRHAAARARAGAGSCALQRGIRCPCRASLDELFPSNYSTFGP